MNAFTHSRRGWQARLWWPWLLGAVATIAAARLSWLAGSLPGLVQFAATMLVVLAVYAGAAALARLHAAGPVSAVVAVFYLGIPLGLVVDALLDRAWTGASRELFPFELATWAAYAALPVAVGTLLAGWLRRGRKPRQPAPAAAAREDAPALWNPLGAALFSLVLTPLFGALLHIANWHALGREDKAAQARAWAWLSALVMVGGYALSPAAGLLALDAVLLAWLAFPAREQVVYVRRRFGRGYPRRPWPEAAAMALALLACMMLLAFVLAPLRVD